jgi:hypothetical protein
MGEVQICRILANRARLCRILHANRKGRQIRVCRECQTYLKEKRSPMRAYFPSGISPRDSGIFDEEITCRVFCEPSFMRSVKKALSVYPGRQVIGYKNPVTSPSSYGATGMPGQFLPRSRPGQCIPGEREASHHQRSRRYTQYLPPAGDGVSGQASV